jgi:hypothetical protein
MKRKWPVAALGLLVAGAIAAPALAHEPNEGRQERQKIIIMTDRHANGSEARGEADRRRSRIIVADCGGDTTEVSGENESKSEKAKVVICTRGHVSSADRAKRLEHALERINANDDLSVETKARITTALRDAIARLNATTR